MKAIITRMVKNTLSLPQLTPDGGWKEEYDETIKFIDKHPYIKISEEVTIELPELETRLSAIEKKLFT